MKSRLTKDEKKVLKLLGDAWNAYCELPTKHPCDANEFLLAIHAAENVIMARPEWQGTPPKEKKS